MIFLSFASIKVAAYQNARRQIYQILTELYNRYDFLLDGGMLNEKEKAFYRKVSAEMDEDVAIKALNVLSFFLARYYDRKVLILFDESFDGTGTCLDACNPFLPSL